MDFVVLTNRKRAVVALVHSVVFLLIAVATLVSSKPAAGLLQGAHASAALVTCAIYLVVTTVLFLLLRVSICAKERLYFGFCTSSAFLGLLRTVLGDPPFHAGQYLRVVFLACAVFTGMVIARTHAETPPLPQ